MREASAFAAMYNYERKTRGGSKPAGRSTGTKKRTSSLDAGAIGQQGASSSTSGFAASGASQGGKAFHPGQQLHDARIYNVIKVAWVKNNRDAPRHIAAHCNYIEKRERGHAEKERTFFTRERDAVSRSEVIEMIMDHRGAMYFGKAMYKVILSPNTNDLDRQDMTRAVMDKFEKETGSRLHWAAVEHENTLHNHVHIVIAALREDGKQFALKPKELEQLRAIGHEYQFEIRHEHLRERDLIAREMSYFREYAHELTQRDVDRNMRVELEVDRPRVDEVANQLLNTDRDRDREQMHEFGLDKYYYNVEKDFKEIKDEVERGYFNEIKELAKEHPELFPGLDKQQANFAYELPDRSMNKSEHAETDEREPAISTMVVNLYNYSDLSRSTDERTHEENSLDDRYSYPDLQLAHDIGTPSEIDRAEDQESSFVHDLAGTSDYENTELGADFESLWGEDSQPVYEDHSAGISYGPEDRDDHDERDDEDYFL
ncbi:MAG: hypothetical protein K2X77_13425 [Candidatus Obscuribacterales bacterium]|nr:hypothetical protein [Candidatus Obscuribacterales bacterium]